MKKPTVATILIGIGLFLSACSIGNQVRDSNDLTTQNTYSNISVKKLKVMFEEKDFLLINVHVPFAGNLPETDNSIPFDQISQNISSLPENKDAQIVIYCRSGSMSSAAAKELVTLGYTNVVNLEGGFNAWVAAGFPMDQN